MRTTLSATAVALLLAGCVTSDDAYTEAVRRHIARGGPTAACCTAVWEARHADQARCEADAITRCQFAKDATVRALRVASFGHDDGAMVDVEVAGPAGRAICHYQVLNYPKGNLSVQGGSCDAF